jgi:HAD superfamily hydrolase (TIGR01549 family)
MLHGAGSTRCTRDRHDCGIATRTRRRLTPLFDFDGTLVDSDEALVAPFVALGVEPPPLGLPLVDACSIAGIEVDDYLARYDAGAVHPFPGVDELIVQLDQWGLCSNKQRASGLAELRRLDWSPDVALFSDDFGGKPKTLDRLLAALELEPHDAIYVGDTEHDRACARAVGMRFALAGWNARAEHEADDLVLRSPAELLDLLS